MADRPPCRDRYQVQLDYAFDRLLGIKLQQVYEVLVPARVRVVPAIKPSGMDKATDPSKPAKTVPRQGRGKITPRVGIEDQVVKAAVPPGSRFKGHEPLPGQAQPASVCRFAPLRCRSTRKARGTFGDSAQFDGIFRRRTGFATLDRLLARLHANKAELLRLLDRPEIPLHTNDSEKDIRCHITRRKVSAGTPSDNGRNCRDAFLSLTKTREKRGIPIWDFLGSRLKIAGHILVQPLDHYVRGSYSVAC